MCLQFLISQALQQLSCTGNGRQLRVFVGDWSATVRGLVGDCLNPQNGADVNEKRRKSRRRSIALACKADADIIPTLSDGTMIDKEWFVEHKMTTKTTAIATPTTEGE